MIDRLESDYPGFKERLIDEEGELRYFVNIYVNGEDIRFDHGWAPPSNPAMKLA
ncbi:Putative sulfur carrier protein slr0821 [Geodia barretti]|nr:Putative sulfur carrier protein slr0821 [Geodia barretti]